MKFDTQQPREHEDEDADDAEDTGWLIFLPIVMGSAYSR